MGGGKSKIRLGLIFFFFFFFFFFFIIIIIYFFFPIYCIFKVGNKNRIFSYCFPKKLIHFDIVNFLLFFLWELMMFFVKFPTSSFWRDLRGARLISTFSGLTPVSLCVCDYYFSQMFAICKDSRIKIFFVHKKKTAPSVPS